jgi:hypothetical protein
MPSRYTFPTAFDFQRAQELATLVNAAYDQLDKFDQGAPWVPPPGYTVIATLSAKEIWKAPPPLSEVLLQLLKPKPFGFVATKAGVVYIVIRGTRTPLEWFDDFAALPVSFQPSGKPWGKTTHGFLALYTDPGIGPTINNALTTLGPGGLGQVFVTGHSLGAALAHLAAAGIKAQFTAVSPVSYTFCGPRTGDADFAAAYVNAKLPIWRVVNTEDIVPTVPPAAVEFATPNAGVHGLSVIGRELIRLIQMSPAGYQHVGYPLAVTFHADTISGNHSLDALCTELASTTPM